MTDVEIARELTKLRGIKFTPKAVERKRQKLKIKKNRHTVSRFVKQEEGLSHHLARGVNRETSF